MTIEIAAFTILALGFLGSIIGGLWHISRIITKFEASVEALALSVNDLKVVVNGFDNKVDSKIFVAIEAVKKDVKHEHELWSQKHENQHSLERHSIADKVSAIQLSILEELNGKQDKK